MRAQREGEHERGEELSRPIAALLQMTADGHIVKQTANDVHVGVEMTPELKTQIAALADDIRGRRRRKRPHRRVHETSKRTA